ncbi:MAG: flagellar hook-associated protein FlgL [Ignavibacteriales bacterium]|nr:flagellar hook-associated protein FlgL [Ignavibacteriales bacterium]
MRISDLIISNNYIGNTNKIKDRISTLNKQIMSGNKIEKPSDSPVGTSRLFRISDQMGQTETYKKNIQNSLSFLDETIFAMESMQSEAMSIVGKLTELQNPINQTNLEVYADMIDNSLKIMLETSNSKSDGKYIFGGTDYSSEPYGISSDNQSYQSNTDTSGKINVKFSQSVVQSINMPGLDLFGTIVSSKGFFNTADVVGTVTNVNSTIHDDLGNEYQLQTNYQKTAANTYQMTYDIVDGGGATVFTAPPGAKTLVFNNLNGNLVSVDGSTSDLSFAVEVPANRIQFTMNLKTLSENSSATSISLSANQPTNIFNTLKQLSNDLRNGIVPSNEQIAAVENFNSRLTSKQSQVGNTINQISTLQSMLEQQTYNLMELAQNENGVDIAKAVVDLQNQDYLLQISQKLGSMILQKTLLDYI